MEKKTVSLKIAPFLIDVTPPVGFNLSYGINQKVHSPIYIRGVAVDDGTTKAALAACDFLFVAGSALETWKKTIADAIGTLPENVFPHSVHQHDSVLAYPELNALVRKHLKQDFFADDYFEKVTEDLKTAVRKAVKTWKTVKNIAVSEERLQGLASNRRLLGPDGKIKAMRWSGADEKLQKYPVGLIDPFLRTVAFLGDNDKVLTALHYYTTHPQSIVRRMVTSDVPGAALEYVRKNSDSAAHHIYFTGCGANITFGKYNLADQKKNPPDERIKKLGEKLGRGIVSNLKRLEKKPLSSISIKHSSFAIPLSSAVSKPDIKSLEANIVKKLKDAEKESLNPMTVVWPYGFYIALRKNWKKLSNPRLSLLSIGDDINIMSLPAETVVDYQLYAQSLIPEKFLACAAYGEAAYMYIPTGIMYKEGGYEPSASVTTKAVEKRYKTAIKKLIE